MTVVGGRLVVLVEFRLTPGARDAFLEAVTINARSSVRDEPGCLRFDILTDHGKTRDSVVLYEIYENSAAFDAHRQTPHFATFHEATDGMVEKRILRLLDVIENAA